VFPRIGAKGKITGWDKEGAGIKLMQACAYRGVWSAEGKVRGAGAHRDDDGGLILHCGDMIQIAETDRRELLAGSARTWAHPGMVDGYVYPAAARTPRPAIAPVGPEVARMLLTVLKSWNWERPEIDPQLCLGWIISSLACGAFDWRAMIWLTGGKGTGKSTLWRLIQLLLGEGGLLHASEVTEAWIRQTLKMRTLPVALDEVEAEEDGRRMARIVGLARLASSGGKIGRGSADHEAQDFTMRSSFFFSSILHPPFSPQDKSRISVLDLRAHDGERIPAIDPEVLRDVAGRLHREPRDFLPLIKDGGQPMLTGHAMAFWGEVGRMLRRRLVDEWPRLDQVIENYRVHLGRNGHDARGQDQHATLLAAADVALWDEDQDSEDMTYAAWGKLLAVDKRASAEDDEPFLVVQKMATSALPGRGGDEPETVGMWVTKVIKADEEDAFHARAQKRLEMAGMVVVASELVDEGAAGIKRKTRRFWGGPLPTAPNAPDIYVAVACAHQGIEMLLRDTRWQKGVWNQALGRIEGGLKRVKVQIGGRPEWATLVPIAAFAAELEADA